MLQSNFFMYAMNLITLVKPYKSDIYVVIWHSAKFKVRINNDLSASQKIFVQNELLLHDIFNRPLINDRLSINCNTFDIVI